MKLTADESQTILSVLRKRFEKNMQRHPDILWPEVESRLTKFSGKLGSLMAMEETGGEPDVTGRDEKTGEIIFMDCAAESPKGRRSLCYDRAAWESRKEFKPENSAMDVAEEMGIELLSEADYFHLQTLGEFDTKTSSWLLTPAPIRKLKGAIFGDRRYNHVFIYHNGAESYYTARGFRGKLRI